MPIKGKVLYSFRWFWRQDISTQAVQAVLPQPLKNASTQKKR
jgi:hypothetical protein